MKNDALKIFTLILIITLTSCKKRNYLNEKIEYYSGNKNQIYKQKILFDNYDSLIYYYDNNQIFKKGKQRKNGKPFGIWNLYDKEGNLIEIREWFVIEGHSRINRVWYLNQKGDTLDHRPDNHIFNQKEFINDTLGAKTTSFNIFNFNKDTIKVNEYVRAFAYCGSPLISHLDSEILVVLPEEGNDFNDDFSNENEIKTIKFYNLTIDTINQKWFKSADKQYLTPFWYSFDTSGEKILRGYMVEYATGKFENDVDSITSKTYFEKKIYVTE